MVRGSLRLTRGSTPYAALGGPQHPCALEGYCECFRHQTILLWQDRNDCRSADGGSRLSPSSSHLWFRWLTHCAAIRLRCQCPQATIAPAMFDWPSQPGLRLMRVACTHFAPPLTMFDHCPQTHSMTMSILPRHWTDKQVPECAEIFLDHVGWFVGDLDQAAVRLQRLGFAPSAVWQQQNVMANGAALPSGTSNRLVRLRRGFLEFLAATSDTALAEQLRRALVRYEGLHLIALSHADLESQRARLVKCGFEMQSMVRLPGRTDEEVSWSVLRTLPHVMPEGRIQFVYPHTPELSWPPGTTEHPNHADSLTGVMVCTDQPDEAKDRFGVYLGSHMDPNGLTTDRGRVHIVGPENARDILPDFVPPSLPCIAAVTVMTTDLDETHRVIRYNGIVPLVQSDGILWISPADALGCYLGFHDRNQVPMESLI